MRCECGESTCTARRSRALPAPSRQRAAPGRMQANRPDSATWRPLVLLRAAPQLAVACHNHLETCARHLRLEQRCNNRKDLQLKASCQPCKHHSTRRKYEPTHQWMPCGTIAAPPQSVEVATPPPACVEVAALWPTYSRITVVIHHPWRATGPSTGMGRDRFSHEQRGATSSGVKSANIHARALRRAALRHGEARLQIVTVTF